MQEQNEKSGGATTLPRLRVNTQPKLLMVVVTVYRLTLPDEVGAKAGVLDRILSVAVQAEPAGVGLVAGTVLVRRTDPIHRTGMVVARPNLADLNACLGHGDHLGKVGNARLVAIGSYQNVAHLGAAVVGNGIVHRHMGYLNFIESQDFF
jgi:hypothetical protein